MEIKVDLPERYLLNMNGLEMARRLKLYTALLMYQAKQMSAGAACEFAGTDRYSFLAACKEHRIPVIGYEPEELETEIQQFEHT